MDMTFWIQLVVVCFLGAASPGPSLALLIGNSIDRGRAYGMATGLGHAVGITLWGFLTAVGATEVMNYHSGLMVVMQVGGAIILAYVGLRTFRSKSDLENQQGNVLLMRPGILFKAVREGFLISFLNPKIALFFLAIFSHLVYPGLSWSEKVLMGIVAGFIDGLWYVSVAIFVTGIVGIGMFRGKFNLLSKLSGAILLSMSIYLFGKVAWALWSS
jgi:threonine/homoserine/homoserine lactone efflux protein